MKRIINTLLFMFAAITMMAQNSFVVADKNDNSQLVQSLIFQQQQNADRFTWKSDGTASGDIKDVSFIARAQAELATASTDDVTEMLEQLSGTDLADAEAIAATLKSNSVVEDAYTVDGENMVYQKKGSQYHTIYPMYDLKPAFSESDFEGAKQLLGKQYVKPRKAMGSSSQKVAIFNFFQGDPDYALQNQLVEMIYTLFDTNNYDVTMYENSKFTMKNLQDVIDESKSNKNYKAIIIMSHGAMLTDASFSAEGLSVFMTGEECGQYDSCDKMYDSKSKKYLKTHSSAIYPDKDCILYLGSCYGAYWGEKHWKGDSNYDYSITSGIDPHEFDLPYAGLKTKGKNETSQVISYPDKDELTVVAWYGRNSIAQAHAAILFYRMIYNEQGLPDAIRSSFWIDPINWETHLFVSRSISPNHSLTLSGLQENKPDYMENVNIKLTNINRDMFVSDKSGCLELTGDIIGDNSIKMVRVALCPIFTDGKSFNPRDSHNTRPYLIYSQNTKHYFTGEFSLKEFSLFEKEGLYAIRIFGPNWKEIRIQNPYYIVFSRNFSENYALSEPPAEDVYTPSIVDDNGQSLEEITVGTGANSTFDIDGFNSHTFWALSLDENIAKVAVSGTSLTVAGVSEGTTYIGVQDNQNKLIAVAKVTVTKGDDIPNYTSCPDNHHPHLIDLGLPSGTKWACCNVGASKPEESGDWYAWGATVVEGDEENDKNNLFTYNEEWGYYEYNFRDIGTDIAGTKYDVAHVKWGGSWVMPNIEQINELEANCSYEWFSAENGICGYLFTASNGAIIFFITDGESEEGNEQGVYWSSSLYKESGWQEDEEDYVFDCANTLAVEKNYGVLYGIEYRAFGRHVRPVMSK